VAAAAPPIADLLADAPGLRVLATSRMRLAIAGERVYPVDQLRVPSHAETTDLANLGQVDAVRLFVMRAQDAHPTFSLSTANAAAVAAICARLDGLPLAIELAAARSHHLVPSALLKRLDGSLALLSGGPRNLPQRQQTLHETIAWSYGLLDQQGQALFRRVSIFVGGCTVEAAEAVCVAPEGLPALGGDVLLGLSALADQSLLVVVEGPEGEPRFRMLETVRVFGREKLHEAGEQEALASAHAAWCLALAEQAMPALQGPEQDMWLARLEQEHDNLRAALRWAVGRREGELGLRLAGSLCSFWHMRGYLSEGRGWLEAALASSGLAAPVVQARVLNGAGILAFVQGDYDRATALLEEALVLRREFGDKQGIATSLNNLGMVASTQGDNARAVALHAESLSLYRELGDKMGIATSLDDLGVVAYMQGDYTQATDLHEESLALRRVLGERQGIAWSLTNLGLVSYMQGDYPRAVALHEESLALQRELAFQQGIANSLYCLGLVAYWQDDYGRAQALIEESLLLSRDIGHRELVAAGLECLAWMSAAQNRPRQAARLGGAAEALREALGVPLWPELRAGHEQAVEAMREVLGEEAFAAAWAEGRAMPLEAVIAHALEVNPAPAR
jgi:predicted ATPase